MLFNAEKWIPRFRNNLYAVSLINFKTTKNGGKNNALQIAGNFPQHRKETEN